MEIRREEKMQLFRKLICMLIVIILFFRGIGVVSVTSGSSFSDSVNVSDIMSEVLYAVDYVVEEPVVCIPAMLSKGFSFSSHIAVAGNTIRWQNREVLLFLVVGVFLQYLFSYQSAEGREDGQLFLCRKMIVDYIHRMDSGE